MGTADAAALVVVDMQRAVVTGSGAVPGAADLESVVHHLVRRARDAGSLVVHVQNDGASGSADEPETPGWALVLEPMIGEPVIRKHSDDAFVDTDLEALLRDVGADVVVICGVQSEMCVAATARSAMERGLVVVLPRDAHGTYPVPADSDGGVAVPATQVARVAEWSLGDELVAPTSSADVIFHRLHRRAEPVRPYDRGEVHLDLVVAGSLRVAGAPAIRQDSALSRPPARHRSAPRQEVASSRSEWSTRPERGSSGEPQLH